MDESKKLNTDMVQGHSLASFRVGSSMKMRESLGSPLFKNNKDKSFKMNKNIFHKIKK